MTKSNDRSSKSDYNTGINRELDPKDYMGRAVIVLTCLGNGKNGIADICKATGLIKSTVHRMLTKLVNSGLAMHDPVNHQYLLGPLFTRFSSAPQITHKYLIHHAKNEMERLSEIFGEMVVLGVLVGLQYIRLHIIQSKHTVSIVQGNWLTRPFMFKGASVKTLVAQVKDEELEKIYRNAIIKTPEDLGLRNMETFFNQIKEIRQHGYAMSRGETIPESMVLSVPIKNYTFPSCLSVIGLESRQASRLDETIHELKQSAQNISNDLIASCNLERF